MGLSSSTLQLIPNISSQVRLSVFSSATCASALSAFSFWRTNCACSCSVLRSASWLVASASRMSAVTALVLVLRSVVGSREVLNKGPQGITTAQWICEYLRRCCNKNQTLDMYGYVIVGANAHLTCHLYIVYGGSWPEIMYIDTLVGVIFLHLQQS